MNAKTLIQIEKPQTQTVEAVKSLLAWRGRAADPLPSFLEMGSGDSKVVLVLSNKKDSYYTVTRSDCSCPASVYHKRPCKHQRKYFPEQSTTTRQTMADTLEQAEANLHKMPYRYQQMVKAAREAAEDGSDSIMPREPFRPFLEDHGRPTGTAKEPSSSPVPLIDTLGEPTPGELAYHSIQADREIWPCEA